VSLLVIPRQQFTSHRFCTEEPSAPHPPNAHALGPSLSPLSRGEVYARLPTGLIGNHV